MKFGGKLLIFLLLLVIGGGGFFAWNELETKTAAMADLEQKNTELTQEADKLKQQASVCEESKKALSVQIEEFQRSTCKGVWTPEGGCQVPQQVFTTPAGGETFCFGKTVDVTWNSALVKDESVDVLLATSKSAAKLATLQNMDGVYHWEVKPKHNSGDSGSFTIAEGLYKLRLEANGAIIPGSETAQFSIKSCNGKAVKTIATSAKKSAAAPKKMVKASAKIAKPAAKKKH